ncbi:MAG: hypothetical protein WA941_08570 [Nitrososphaeraceae archaeon]
MNTEIAFLSLRCVKCNGFTTAYLNTGDRTDRDNVGLQLSFMSKIYCESCVNNFGDFDKREFSDPRSLK